MPNRTAACRAPIAHELRQLLMAVALALPSALALGVIETKADEAYVCEGGRIVNVRMGELEVMKRKDPCIAAYYGIKPDSVVTIAIEPPLPERKPQIASPHAPRTAARSAHEAASSTDVDIVTAPRVEPVVFKHAVVRSGASSIPSEDGGKLPVDFRRVPILNAQPGAPAIYYHTR